MESQASVICAGVPHTLKLLDRGRLIFGNHTMEELRRHQAVAALGGRPCMCARIYETWLSLFKQSHIDVSKMDLLIKTLPDNFQARVQSWALYPLEWRILRRLNTHSALAYNLIDKECDEVNNTKASDFSAVFLDLLARQLRVRGYDIQQDHDGAFVRMARQSQKILGRFDTQVCINRPKNNALICKLHLPADHCFPRMANIVKNKNVQRALYIAVDELEKRWFRLLFEERHELADKIAGCQTQEALNLWSHGQCFKAIGSLSGSRIEFTMRTSTPSLTMAAAELLRKRLRQINQLINKLGLWSRHGHNEAERRALELHQAKEQEERT